MTNRDGDVAGAQVIEQRAHVGGETSSDEIEVLGEQRVLEGDYRGVHQREGVVGRIGVANPAE